MTVKLTDEMIDAGARHLRETTQAGKVLTDWGTVPKSAKRKWLTLSEGTLRAALLSPEAPASSKEEGELHA